MFHTVTSHTTIFHMVISEPPCSCYSHSSPTPTNSSRTLRSTQPNSPIPLSPPHPLLPIPITVVTHRNHHLARSPSVCRCTQDYAPLATRPPTPHTHGDRRQRYVPTTPRTGDIPLTLTEPPAGFRAGGTHFRTGRGSSDLGTYL